MGVLTASCVVIGNEILSGKVRDHNAHHLSVRLRRRGVDLQHIQVIPDVVETIAAVVAQESARSDVVITSGGVGPTHDDLTYRGVAAAFGYTVERHPELAALMATFYGDKLTPVRLRMADVPSPATLHHAPGLWVPVVQVNNVYVLPGIPVLFERLLEALDPVLTGVPITLCSVYTQQLEEEIATLLEQVVARFPGVELGSYPRIGDPDHKVRVTLESRDAQAAHQATRALVALLDPARLVRVEE